MKIKIMDENQKLGYIEETYLGGEIWHVNKIGETTYGEALKKSQDFCREIGEFPPDDLVEIDISQGWEPDQVIQQKAAEMGVQLKYTCEVDDMVFWNLWEIDEEGGSHD